MKKNSSVHLFYFNLLELEVGVEPWVMEVIQLTYPQGGLAGAIRSDIYLTMRSFSELYWYFSKLSLSCKLLLVVCSPSSLQSLSS